MGRLRTERPGGQEQLEWTGAMRAESTLCSYAEETLDLESLGSLGLGWRALGCFPQVLLLNWIQAVCFALAMHRAFRRVRQRATHRSRTDPVLRQPGSRQRDPKVCLAAPGHRSLFQGAPPQRFSHSTAKHRADAERFSLLPQTATASSAQAECPPFSSAVRPAKLG